ncbi:hypothetical protein [Flavobacterium hungaricum]|uniref:Uncharacterized protein n=1 Tax=Flavobacterium hungaricum TaxID=2082725 RepID=A0ABR9TRH1_9FLAO|nr:hypothetical protein [Flavobacterium hungaricum]MBE8727602.1 hypothetical protein [Flavobacterium hungaricum]
MALSKKYFIYIIFLVSPVSLSLYAQTTAEKPTENKTVSVNQKEKTADVSISSLDNSNQFMAGLSIPKDSLSMAAESNAVSADCQENSILASTSVLAKDIIENYKYDFSETFIDILFFERIDLARTRTI